jgi:hypothetical protein
LSDTLFLPAFTIPSSPLPFFSSLVGLLSPFPLSGETTWTVYQNDAPTHHERAAIRLAPPHLPIAVGWHLYVCDLVPSLWPTVCEHDSAYYVHDILESILTDSPTGLSSITLVQKVRPVDEPSYSPLSDISISYRFNVHDDAVRMPQPGMPVHTAPHSQYPIPSSPASPQASHPSFFASPRYPSYPQKHSYSPSRSQNSYDYRSDEYYPRHSRTHEPVATPDPTQFNEARRYAVAGSEWDGSNTSHTEPRRPQREMNEHWSATHSNRQDVHSFASPSHRNHDRSLASQGHAVFGGCTNIAVNNYGHITSRVEAPAPPPPGMQSPLSSITLCLTSLLFV